MIHVADRMNRVRAADLLLSCPDCRGAIQSSALGATCGQCGRQFALHGTQLDLLPSDAGGSEQLELGSKYRGRLRTLSPLLRRAYRILSPDPIRFKDDRQRTYGKNAHRRVLEFAKEDASVLDLGSGDRRILPHVVTADISLGPNIDLRLDAHHLPFPNASWHRVILQNVLEHVEHPAAVMREIARVLQPGGMAYVEVPFLFPAHDRADYRRWSVLGLKAENPFLTPVEDGVTIGPWTALTVSARATLTHRIRNAYVATLVDAVAGWILLPLQLLDAHRGDCPEQQICAGAVFVVFRKTTDAEVPSG